MNLKIILKKNKSNKNKQNINNSFDEIRKIKV